MHNWEKKDIPACKTREPLNISIIHVTYKKKLKKLEKKKIRSFVHVETPIGKIIKKLKKKQSEDEEHTRIDEWWFMKKKEKKIYGSLNERYESTYSIRAYYLDTRLNKQSTRLYVHINRE